MAAAPSAHVDLTSAAAGQGTGSLTLGKCLTVEIDRARRLVPPNTAAVPRFHIAPRFITGLDRARKHESHIGIDCHGLRERCARGGLLKGPLIGNPPRPHNNNGPACKRGKKNEVYTEQTG